MLLSDHRHSRKRYAPLLFHGEGPYYIETSPLISCVNQWTAFSMIGTSIITELIGSYRLLKTAPAPLHLLKLTGINFEKKLI